MEGSELDSPRNEVGVNFVTCIAASSMAAHYHNYDIDKLKIIYTPTQGTDFTGNIQMAYVDSVTLTAPNINELAGMGPG